MKRREFLVGTVASGCLGALQAIEKTTDGGLAPVSWATRPTREISLVPAGAGGVRALAAKCVGCALCEQACPSHCLRLSARSMRPELDFRYGYCRPNCTACAQACPTGAIKVLKPLEKRLVHIGGARWVRARCLRETEGVKCHACEKHCPEGAIQILAGFPVVDAAKCVGCGACEHYCPARPMAAITVQAYERHQQTRPIAEADLLEEMRRVLDTGKACVVASGGVIVAAPEGRGVAPLLCEFEQGHLGGALVLDRVIGRAAAAILIAGGAKKVVAPVVSAAAREMLEKAGIEVGAAEVVPAILNRDRTSSCPLDAAVEELTEPYAIIKRLQQVK